MKHLGFGGLLDGPDRFESEAHSALGRDAPKLLTILPRGEAIRNFVHTGALEEVALQAEVSLLSVAPSREIWQHLCARYSQVFELQECREAYLVGCLRELLDMAHGRWLWSEAARERWRLRDLEAATPAAKLQRLAKKLTGAVFANPVGLALLCRAERTASRALRTTDEYTRLLRELCPSLVFNGSHVHSRVAIQAVQAAQWLGIPTATFIFSWDNLTSQGRVIPAYDYYLVWSEALRQQLLQIYPAVRPEQVFVVGTPQFDFHFRPEFYWTRERFCAAVGADPARPIVLYSTGMPNHMPGEPEIVEGIAGMLREMTAFGPPQLLVRVYPKDRTGRFEALKRRCPEILFPEVPWEPAWLTPKLEDAYLLTNTLRHAAVGVNVASTVSLELCMFDKPVINVGYNPPHVAPEVLDYHRYYSFDHYRPVVESGAVGVACSPAEMARMLGQALSDPQAASQPRRDLLYQMFGDTLDGCSGSRVAEVLVALTRAGSRRPPGRVEVNGSGHAQSRPLAAPVEARGSAHE